MKLSMRQRIAVCILAVAAAALVVDRAFLRPGDATPAEADAALSAALDELPCALDSRTSAAEERTLAARLRDLSASEDPGSGDVRDAFRPSQAWLAVLFPPPPEAPPESKPESRKPVHRLTAVILDKNGDRAIVDGKCLHVGQEIDGVKLISVGQRSAILESRGTRVELKLETSAQADASQ
jgi:hypothetical protein